MDVKPLLNSEKNASESSNSNNHYAVYIINHNKHISPTEINHNDDVSNTKNEAHDFDRTTYCLSLLEGNIQAELETVLRCYLLKSMSVYGETKSEDDGKFTSLQAGEDSEKTYHCYYYRLNKSLENAVSAEEESAKLFSFFVCLIGPSDGVMESFQPELEKYCISLKPLLDPVGLKNQERMQSRLSSWYYFCIEFIARCIKNFETFLPSILHASLWGNVKIICADAEVLWDLERFVDTCCLMPNWISENSTEEEALELKVKDGKILVNKVFEESSYCKMWANRLKNCIQDDHKVLHSLLEAFRLKGIQDLNTLKRFVQKAEADYYSLFRACVFVKQSGYASALLHLVQQEAMMSKEYEILEVIKILQEFTTSEN